MLNNRLKGLQLMGASPNPKGLPAPPLSGSPNYTLLSLIQQHDTHFFKTTTVS